MFIKLKNTIKTFELFSPLCSLAKLAGEKFLIFFWPFLLRKDEVSLAFHFNMLSLTEIWNFAHNSKPITNRRSKNKKKNRGNGDENLFSHFTFSSRHGSIQGYAKGLFGSLPSHAFAEDEPWAFTFRAGRFSKNNSICPVLCTTPTLCTKLVLCVGANWWTFMHIIQSHIEQFRSNISRSAVVDAIKYLLLASTNLSLEIINGLGEENQERFTSSKV